MLAQTIETAGQCTLEAQPGAHFPTTDESQTNQVPAAARLT